MFPRVTEGGRPGTDAPADRVPPGYFRDDATGPARDARDSAPGENERTREMPQIDPNAPRPRPDWAEETPWTTSPAWRTSCSDHTTRVTRTTRAEGAVGGRPTSARPGPHGLVPESGRGRRRAASRAWKWLRAAGARMTGAGAERIG